MLFFNHIMVQGQKKQVFGSTEIADFEKKAKRGHLAFKRSGAGGNIDLRYHRLEWEIDPNVLYIKGAVTTYFVPSEESTSSISFDLDQKLNVDSVKYNNTTLNSGSVFVEDTISTDRIFNWRLSYAKGAMLLHMLRGIVGDENFFQGVRNYLNDPELTYDYARTGDLQRHLEQVSGKDLDEFFRDWYYGQGHPVYEFEYERSADNNHSITVWQTTSDSSVDFFEMPLPFNVTTASGKDTVVVFDHTFSGETFAVSLDEPIQNIVFNQDHRILTPSVFVTGIEGDFDNEHLKIFPNPTNGTFAISLGQNFPATTSLQIFDLKGREITSKVLINYQQTYIDSDLSTLPAGVYMLSLLTQNQMINKKIIKQ